MCTFFFGRMTPVLKCMGGAPSGHTAEMRLLWRSKSEAGQISERWLYKAPGCPVFNDLESMRGDWPGSERTLKNGVVSAF